MGNILINKSPKKMESYLEGIQKKQHYMILWQLINNKRCIHVTTIETLNRDLQTFQIKFHAQNEIPFKQDKNIYCYMSQTQCIFKLIIDKIDGNNHFFHYPKQIKFLNNDEFYKLGKEFNEMINDYYFVKGYKYIDPNFDTMKVKSQLKDIIKPTGHYKGVISDSSHQKINTHISNLHFISERDKKIFHDELQGLSIHEEEAMFENLREAPRAKPEEGKMALILRNLEDNKSEKYQLYDLSKGGMAFIALESSGFNEGEFVYLLGFEEKKLDNPLKSEVMSVRSYDELNVQYKIGLRFISDEEEK